MSGQCVNPGETQGSCVFLMDQCRVFLFFLNKYIVIWQTENNHKKDAPSLWPASQIPAVCRC